MTPNQNLLKYQQSNLLLSSNTEFFHIYCHKYTQISY